METVKAVIKYDERRDTSVTPDTSIVKHAVCAVSGGMDSATCLFHAVKLYGAKNVIGVSMYYGQRHDIELQKAKAECEKLGVEYHELNLTPIFSINKNISALLKGSDKEVVQGKDYATLMHEKIEKGEAPISDEYIPNRNSLFLNTLAAIGLQKFENHPVAIFTGIHSDDVLKQEGSNVGAYPDAVAEGSLISMVDGTVKKIEDIEIGDVIWGFNEKTDKIERSVVLNKIDQGKRPVYQCGPAKVSENHLMWLNGNSRKFVRFSDMKRKDATYKAWSWGFDPYKNEKPESFKNGYLRGFIEGDGHISDGRYVSIYQKRKDVLEEFLKLADLTDIQIHEKDAGMFYMNICSQGKELLKKTEDDNSIDYAFGYLNGMIVAEGCYSYNSKMGFIEIEQSTEVNPEKVEKIKEYLNKTGIYYTSYFRSKDSCVSFKFSKAFRIPLKYGASKLASLLERMEKHLNVKSLKSIEIPGIKKAEFLGEMQCYDLTTSSGSFISDGLLVHNCSLEFAVATNKALQLATAGLVYVYTPLVNKTKTQVAEFGIENGMTKEDFNDTWSCYKGVEKGRVKQCSRCPTCLDRIHALVDSGVFTSVKDITDNYDADEAYAATFFRR